MKQIIIVLFIVPIISSAQKSNNISIQIKPFPTLPPKIVEITKFINSHPESKNLPPAVVDWYYWTNYSRQRPKAFWDSVVSPLLQVYPQFNTSYAASLKSELYRNRVLPMVKPNITLVKLAQSHAADLSKTGSLSHSSTNGTPFQQRVFKGGIAKCAAENLSLGLPNPVFSLVLLYLDEGIPDLGHRNNLLSPFYVEMGIGMSKTKNNYTIVVQDFACDQTTR